MPENDKILNNDVAMPRFGLGVWQAKNGTEVETAVTSALKAGYRMIDTAAAYGNEQSVGKAIARSDISRDEIFVTTKLWNADQGYEKAIKAFNKSLNCLQLDYVDLYLIHWPMPAYAKSNETWQALEKLKADGKTRAIGVSNFSKDQLIDLMSHTKTIPAVNQIEIHPGFNQDETREYCQQHGIAVESYSPLGGAGSQLLNNSVIMNIAKKYNKSTAQVIIRWHLQHDLIVIPKSVTPERIRQNFNVMDFHLSDEDMTDLDTLEGGARAGANPDTFNIRLNTTIVQIAHRIGLIGLRK